MKTKSWRFVLDPQDYVYGNVYDDGSGMLQAFPNLRRECACFGYEDLNVLLANK